MIDWDRARQLRDEIGAEDFREVTDLFLQEMQEALASLGDTSDPVALEHALHFLKGSALSFGFRDFSQRCADGERAAAAGCARAVDVPSILAIFDAERADFLAGLPDLTADPPLRSRTEPAFHRS